MKVFVHDVSICNGCYNCQIACKDEHCDNDWAPYAKPQPETGQFWLKLNEYIRGTVPKVKMHYIPSMCMHCRTAKCMTVCPVDDAIYRREDGLVIISPEKCNGCKDCLDACPYDAIYFNQDLNIAQKCSGCAHLLDQGWTEPRCVEACPTGSLKFMEEEAAKEYISKAEYLVPDRKDSDKPAVYYLNIPKRFIAGALIDSSRNEIVKNALCTLTSGNGETRTAVSDGFGDFWFEGLNIETFQLIIEAKDFAIKTIDNINTIKDVNLGDIQLSLP